MGRSVWICQTSFGVLFVRQIIYAATNQEYRFGMAFVLARMTGRPLNPEITARLRTKDRKTSKTNTPRHVQAINRISLNETVWKMRTFHVGGSLNWWQVHLSARNGTVPRHLSYTSTLQTISLLADSIYDRGKKKEQQLNIDALCNHDGLIQLLKFTAYACGLHLCIKERWAAMSNRAGSVFFSK